MILVRLIVLAGLAFALGACAPPKASDTRLAGAPAEYFGSLSPPTDNVLRFNNGAEPETIDPSIMSGQPDGRVARILFEGLTSADPQTLQPIPGQAYRWDISADGLHYTFHLRPGLTWSDGTPLTARDFVYSWTRVLKPLTASRSASLLYAIENAEAYNQGTLTDSSQVGLAAPDDSTFEVRLAQPTSYFLFLTAYYTYLPVPQRAIERWGLTWTRVEHVVNNGPYRMKAWGQNDRFEFVRNPRYWDAASVKLDGIVAYSVDDLNTSTNLYKAGVIDWNPSGYIPSPFIPYLRHFADYRTGEFQGTYFYSINTKRKPYDNVHVRRALNLAVDRDAIATDLLKGTRRAWGLIAPSGYAGYEPPPPAKFDPERARRELALAGYPGGKGFPKLSILFNTSEDHRRIAEAIQAMWRRELGIDVELSNQEWGSYLQATTSFQYDVARRSWLGDYLDPNTFLQCLATGDGNNRTGWSNAKYDGLLRAAAREVDPVKRFQLMRDAEAIAIDEAPFIPIYHYKTHELVKPYVRGIYQTALDVHPLTRVWIDRGWREHTPIARTGDAATTRGH